MVEHRLIRSNHHLMSHLLSLPPELISEITVRLACKDLKALSLVSFTTRQLVLPSLFRNVRITRRSSQSIKEAYDEMNTAGTNIKHLIQYESHVVMKIRSYGVTLIYLPGAC
jgi:hypothetical protein